MHPSKQMAVCLLSSCSTISPRLSPSFLLLLLFYSIIHVEAAVSSYLCVLKRFNAAEKVPPSLFITQTTSTSTHYYYSVCICSLYVPLRCRLQWARILNGQGYFLMKGTRHHIIRSAVNNSILVIHAHIVNSSNNSNNNIN